MGWKISVAVISRPMSAIEFWIHSVNEICMMSVRKCSISVVRWCIFFRPRSFIFPGRRRLSFFFYQYRWIIFFCRVGLMFFWPYNWEHASFGRNQMSVELAQKNLADLHCKFFMQNQNKKSSSAVKKHCLPASVFKKKNSAMSAERYQSGPYNDRHRPLSFEFLPWTKFAWCRLGKVWSASSNDASFLDPDRSSFLADVDCHFFYQYQWIIYFCRVGLMFSWTNNWEHASFGRN